MYIDSDTTRPNNLISTDNYHNYLYAPRIILLFFLDTLYVQINKKDEVRKNELKGTKRVVKLFIFCALLPGVLLTVPLYLRFRVYIQQVYPIGASDMRIIDNKISTTWCQVNYHHEYTIIVPTYSYL